MFTLGFEKTAISMRKGLSSIVERSARSVPGPLAKHIRSASSALGRVIESNESGKKWLSGHWSSGIKSPAGEQMKKDIKPSMKVLGKKHPIFQGGFDKAMKAEESKILVPGSQKNRLLRKIIKETSDK